MKKSTLALFLILCLAFALLTFASCGKKEAADATTKDTTTAGTTEPAATTTPETTPETAPETAPETTAHVHVPAENYTVARPATCVSTGLRYKLCTECGQRIPETEEVIDALPHTPDPDYSLLEDATCSKAGLEGKYCMECGELIGETVREIPINANAHKIDSWQVSSVASLLNPTGHRSGVCSLCRNTIEEDTEFQHDVQVFTTASGKYSPNYATLGDIRGERHFYEIGNDLLVEYSILWNETLLNLYKSNGTMPTIDTRFAPKQAGTSGNSGIVRWELASDVSSQWCTCKFAGGFEVAAFSTSEADSLYPRFNQTVDDVTAYPNIGGANLGDGQPLGETQWGWHRISIRHREELTNADEIMSGAAAIYKLQVWVYIDGVLVLHNSGTDHTWGGDGSDRKLFSAAPDGNGGIAYTENDNLFLHGAFLDSKRMESGVGYFEIADYSATIGSEFVQNVVKVTNPEPATLTVAEGVELPASMYYKLAD